MHRSGTSFLGECCGALGYALPRDSGGPADDNPRGHFEPQAVVALNEAILTSLGAVWNRVGPLDLPPAANWLDAIDTAMGASFGAAGRVMVKDPRLSLTLPLWRDWAQARRVRLAALIALRDPAEVAWSLSRRDGTGTDAAILSWCEYTLAALEGSQGLPRALVLFPDWTADPAPTLARIAALDGTAGAPGAGPVPDPGQVIAERFLPDAVHGASAPRPQGAIADLARDLFAELAGAAREGSVPDAASLAPWRQRLDGLAALARQIEAAHAPHHRRRAEALARQERWARDLGQRLAATEAQRDETAAAMAEALRATEAQRDEMATLGAERIAAAEAQRDRAAAAAAQRIAAAEAQREEASARLSEMLRATEAQRDEALALAASRIAAAEAQRDEAAAAAAQRITAAEAQRDEVRAAMTGTLRATEAQRDEALALAASRIAAAEAQRDEASARLSEMLRATEAQRDEALALAASRIAAAEAQRDEAAAAAAQRITAAEAQRDEVRAAMAGTLRATETQRDEMTDLAEQRQETILALEEQLAQASAHIEATERTLAETAAWLERERRTVLKPIYRRLYGLGGRTLRSIVPGHLVERIKRQLPVPGGIPRGLAFAPLPPPPIAAKGYAEVPPRAGDKPDIFVLSIINWDFRTQRPQHLATEMAAAGHRVFYLEMEQNPGSGSARPVSPGVQVIRLPGRGMRGLKAYGGVPTPAQARAWVDHFHALADEVGASAVSHVIVEHPYWWNLARHLSPEYQITFDCMDDIGGFSNTEPHVLEAELDMIARADKMLVSSQYLHDKFAPMRPVTMVRNGTDVSHFVNDEDGGAPPEWLAGKLREGAIRVGYVGAIAEWFDVDLLERVARENPDFDIHLCGAVSAERPLRLGDLPNVTLHGEIPYADVPAFHRQMDVLTIPFRLLPIIKACDPVKFYEYSAVMRPTVSTALPELDRAGDLVFRAGDAARFAQQIRRAAPLARDAAFGQRLRQYALDNDWRFRAADILAEIAREPKLSVIVLHYGEDTAMTLATLHAMLGKGEVYPALEVVLVDNGSSPAVLDVLRERAAQDGRITLVENGENLGFARGNNRGIAAATGEYVLLLNNDTFLAPGALLAMVRHLQRNPDIGIVGPMTNNIGNEARIAINYADMDEMARAARALATGHRGQWTPMRVCAYFCAMFRRADLDRLGDLPEIYGRGMFEDDDHCATFRAAGLDIALAEDAFCHHHLSATFDALPSGEKQALFDRNKALFEQRWGPWVPHRYRDGRPDGTL
ncbi:hypothetical protein B0A89_12055 [Paracoccus contaminans]|uniref:Glycosyltransferase 2-like domain-containing protein n=2 Tax=Paracoccus contaminans TaxID=1945662 RepID=A0A1W6CZF4_9RHOB|nr:hypothetical protein B0A89_12055 [Paracoccus contaminans]